MGWGEAHKPTRDPCEALAAAVRRWRDTRTTGAEIALCEALDAYEAATRRAPTPTLDGPKRSRPWQDNLPAFSPAPREGTPYFPPRDSPPETETGRKLGW